MSHNISCLHWIKGIYFFALEGDRTTTSPRRKTTCARSVSETPLSTHPPFEAWKSPHTPLLLLLLGLKLDYVSIGQQVSAI
jgi:hypothetical protein